MHSCLSLSMLNEADLQGSRAEAAIAGHFVLEPPGWEPHAGNVTLQERVQVQPYPAD